VTGAGRALALAAGLTLTTALLGPPIYTGFRATTEAGHLSAGMPYCWMLPGPDGLGLSASPRAPFRFWRGRFTGPPDRPPFGMVLATAEGRRNPESYWGWSHRRGTFLPLRARAAALGIESHPEACAELLEARAA